MPDVCYIYNVCLVSDLFRENIGHLYHLPFSSTFQDENRYSAVRGAHKNLKRAEKARILVSKIPCEASIFVHF